MSNRAYKASITVVRVVAALCLFVVSGLAVGIQNSASAEHRFVCDLPNGGERVYDRDGFSEGATEDNCRADGGTVGRTLGHDETTDGGIDGGAGDDGCIGAAANTGACEPNSEDFREDRHYDAYQPNQVEVKDQFDKESICDDESIADGSCDCSTPGSVNADNCDIVAATEAGVNILGAAAGLAIVGGIMFGGYLYMTGRDNPGQIAAARSKIVWALVALLILLFFWGLLQWLIPGGLL